MPPIFRHLLSAAENVSVSVAVAIWNHQAIDQTETPLEIPHMFTDLSWKNPFSVNKCPCADIWRAHVCTDGIQNKLQNKVWKICGRIAIPL